MPQADRPRAEEGCPGRRNDAEQTTAEVKSMTAEVVTTWGCSGDLKREANGTEKDDATMKHDPVGEGLMEAAPAVG